MELFHNKDVPNAVERLVKDPMFDSIAKFLWSDEEFQEIKANFKNINTVKEFQLNVMAPRRRPRAASDTAATGLRGAS